jgi:chorismate--pyruvate lyase
MKLQWCCNPYDLVPAPPPNIFKWLTKPYVLSKAFKRYCHDLDVTVLSQEFIRTDFEKYSTLSLSDKDPFVRQVFLNGDGIPWSYGRVIIPSQTFERHFPAFEALGSKLIGETLLYDNPLVKRDPFEYTYLNSIHPLFQEIYQNLSNEVPRETLYGRRSVFYIQGDPLLVSEFLLPSLPLYA